MYSKAEYEEKYQQLSDDQLFSLIRNSAQYLEADARKALYEVCTERNFPIEELTYLELSGKALNQEQLEQIRKELKSIPCPRCSKLSTVNPGKYESIVSYVLSMDHNLEEVFLCSTCSSKERWTGIGNSLLLGWWSAWGIFMTPVVIVTNLYRMLFPSRSSNEVFSKFLEKHVVNLHQKGISQDSLSRLIQNFNKSSSL